jgi:hypothetical protein
MLLKLTDLYENRGDVAGDRRLGDAIESLLMPFRIFPI